MRVNSVEYLITKGLGYCCEWYFFQKYKDTDLIAARLGVKIRVVQMHKAAAAEGKCKGEDFCIKDIEENGISPLIRGESR